MSLEGDEAADCVLKPRPYNCLKHSGFWNPYSWGMNTYTYHHIAVVY